LGLGGSFSVEVEATIRRILESPEQHRLIEDGVRTCRTRTFPYAIVYAIETDSVLILAVMHLKHKPGYWRHRLASTSPHAAAASSVLI
jgi:plasmid stabilization system protein ParE